MGARGSALRLLIALCAMSVGLFSWTASAWAAGAPAIGSVWAESVGFTTAEIKAQIDPQEAATSYRVEYGTDTGYGTSVPVPDGSVGEGAEFVVVSQLVTGLTSGVSYHYRIVATNAEGVTYGPDQVLRTFSPVEAGADTCPNAQLRGAQSAEFLPDCRAYEMVSPPDKLGGNISDSVSKTRISTDGNAVQYVSSTGFGDAFGSAGIETEYMAERSAEGWFTHALTPPQEPTAVPALFAPRYEGDLSADLSKGVFFADSPIEVGNVAMDDPNVHAVRNLYLRTDMRTAGPGNYTLLTGCPACASNSPLAPKAPEFLIPTYEPAFVGASSDLSHVFFETSYNLTPDAKGERVKLYESDNGVVHLAGVLPDSACGTPPCAAEESAAGRGAAAIGLGEVRDSRTVTSSAISPDGSRVVFTGPPLVRAKEVVDNKIGENRTMTDENDIDGVGGNLYLRENGKTVQLNVSERSTPDPNGPQLAVYEGASRDDNKIFFETPQALTDEDTETDPSLGGALVDLYMYDVNAPEGHHLTLISKDLEPADNNGTSKSDAVVGVSSDGSYVYFAGANALLPGETIDYRIRRLFVWHEGVIRRVAADLLENDTIGWVVPTTLTNFRDEFRMSPDGQHAVFGMRNPVSVSQNFSTRCEASSCEEIYVYSYGSDKLVCASCSSTGQAPTGDSYIMDQSDDSTKIVITQHLNRVMTDDGSEVFFDTPDALVPEDTNGKRDVYEYDTGTGRVHLISSGRSHDDSFFVETTANGSDVMFTTSEPLVRSEIDGNWDMYDARIKGGIPAQNVAPPAQCESDDCQGPAKAAPAFSLPSSLTFSGAGNGLHATSAVKARPLTRAQRRARALRACRRYSGRKRARCQARVRRRYRTAKTGGRASRRGL
jgi:hypothetical protein